jgi:aryl-alcohol dehydrogenase-like predicted oxidoreductase
VDYVRLGCSGLRVSRIGLGMMSYGDPAAQSWALPEDQAEPIVRRAVEVGVTFFDTADMYSDGAGEVITGRLLTRLFARREDYVLATKVFYPTGPSPSDRGLSRKHLLASVDSSLKRLGTEYVDLYQVHRFDPETPVEEPVHLEIAVGAGVDVTVRGMSGITGSLRAPGSRPFPDKPVGWSNPDMPFDHLVVVMMENHSFDNLLTGPSR